MALLSAAGTTARATTLVHYPMENLAPASLAAGATIPDASPTGAHPATLDDIQEGAWAVLLGLHNASPSRFPVCFQENGQGLLNLRADTDQNTAGAITSRKSPFDGAWHHVACTLQPTLDARATVSSFYLDGELQGTLEKSGGMPEMADAYLEIGTRAKSMLIDEVRISNGVLDVADFLHPRAPLGIGILVR